MGATGEIPKLHYPLMCSWAKQVVASWRRPFICPACGSKVTVGEGARSASTALPTRGGTDVTRHPMTFYLPHL